MTNEMQDQYDFLPRCFYTGFCGPIDRGFCGVAQTNSSDPLTSSVAEASGKTPFTKSPRP